MQPFPHSYTVSADAGGEGLVRLSAEGLPELVSAPPTSFDGPGDQWSPESLLMAACADCFILTFRAIAKAGKLPWVRLQCSAQGTLDRVERQVSFTAVSLTAQLWLDGDTDVERARRALEQAEQRCLISASLRCKTHLSAEVHPG